MIEVLKENYDSFMQSNDKPLFGSDFDGETYRFFESKEEADSYQAHVLAPVDEPEGFNYHDGCSIRYISKHLKVKTMKFGFDQLKQHSPIWAKRLRNYGTLFITGVNTAVMAAPANVIHDKAAAMWCLGLANTALIFICGMFGIGDEQAG